MELKSTYRLVPVHPDVHRLVGLHWKNTLYADKALPLGLRSASKISTTVADGLT